MTLYLNSTLSIKLAKFQPAQLFIILPLSHPYYILNEYIQETYNNEIKSGLKCTNVKFINIWEDGTDMWKFGLCTQWMNDIFKHYDIHDCVENTI